MRLGIFLLVSYIFHGCSNANKISNASQKKWIAEGYFLLEKTKKYSEGDCGFLLLDAKSDSVMLYMPVSWPKELESETEGLKAYVKFRPSRIRQTNCFNAQPILIDSVVRLK